MSSNDKDKADGAVFVTLASLALMIVLIPYIAIAEHREAKRVKEAEYKEKEERQREESARQFLIDTSIEKLEENGYEYTGAPVGRLSWRPSRVHYTYTFYKEHKRIILGPDQLISLARKL